MTNPNLGAYYRLGDPGGSFSVIDSSGNGNTGSLIAGTGGTPDYGYAGLMLYDPSTALDLTSGTNVLNGGFQTADNAPQPPTAHQPLGAASSWTFECWLKWTTTNNTTPGEVLTFTGSIFVDGVIQADNPVPGLSVGDAITGTFVAAGTTVKAIFGQGIILSQNATNAGAGTFSATGGAVGSTIFSAASVSGLGSDALDIRVGANTVASVTAFNRVTLGPYNVGANSYLPVGNSTGAINIQDGNWHYLAIPYASSAASVYIDGAFDSSFATGSSWANPQSITIGCDDGPANGWVGAMSDVALYTTTLTASQIANHNNIGRWFTQQEYGASVGGTNAGRFNKLMAVEGLDSTVMLNVPYPFRTLMYAETNNVTTTSGLNYLQTMSETEPGLIFQGPNGIIQALSRQYQYLAPAATTSQGIFGDSNAASVQFHYDGPSFALVQDDLDVWNNVQVQSGRSGSQLQQSISPSSASVYGSRTLQGLTSLQFQNDSDALAVAENYLQWYANPVKRVVSISINSWGNNGNNIPQMLQRGLYDRITIQYQGQTPGPQFSQDSLIESISHSVSMTGGGTWATTYQMSPYEILLTPFIFGASVGSASNQLAGAASVTGSGTAWVLHNPPVNDFYSGTITFTVASGATTTVAYNSTAAQCQTALAALVPSTTVSGGPLNTTNINITFGSSQGSFSAYFSPSNSLTL